jgi:putative ABC transport system substrate-binding protein
MKRRAFIALISGLAIALPLASYAQLAKQPLKQIGVLADQAPCPLQRESLIVRRLGELGWIEGQTIAFDCVSTGEEDRQFAASALGFTWQDFPATTANDYDEIFARLAAEHFDAVSIPGLPLNNENRTRICELVLRHRIPDISDGASWAKCGLLLTYGQDFTWSVSHAMHYVDKILRGAQPGDLAVEQATKLLLTINLKTAKELGLTVPPSLTARADEVIE